MSGASCIIRFANAFPRYSVPSSSSASQWPFLRIHARMAMPHAAAAARHASGIQGAESPVLGRPPLGAGLVGVAGFSARLTVWPASSMSAWTATSAPSLETVLNATMSWPLSALPSNVKLRLTEPDDLSGTNEVVAVTSFPPNWTGLPVSLSMSVPVTAYSSPG